jgi:predicted nucleotidyltransferase
LALPEVVGALATELAGVPGVAAVVLGGSRAASTHRPDSDWDLGIYYRGSQRAVDPSDIRALGREGYVSMVGEWGPVINGGAWLTAGGTPVDVLYRDLDVIEGWARDAEEGRFDVLMQSGYIVGAPTYLPVGELARCRPLSGEVPRPAFPPALAQAAESRWRGRASVALMFARGHARREDAVCCSGMLSAAVLCAGHSRLAARREWALNEKALVRRAGFDSLQSRAAAPGATAAQLTATVDVVAAQLGVDPLRTR